LSRPKAATSSPSWAAYPQVAVAERPLPVEQQLVHVPEPALQGGGLRRGRRGEGERVDAGQREMPEREPHVPAEQLAGQLDRVERLPRVRALVVGVLDDHTAYGRAPDVIDVLVQWRQGQLVVVRYRVEGHGPPPDAAGGSGRPGGTAR
jgi:hypothetical protein